MNNNPKFQQALTGIYKDGVKKFNIRTTPKVVLRKDAENGAMTLGRTAYYDPNDLTIVLYTSNQISIGVNDSSSYEF